MHTKDDKNGVACSNCGTEGKRLRRGRCPQCYRFYMQDGAERPLEHPEQADEGQEAPDAVVEPEPQAEEAREFTPLRICEHDIVRRMADERFCYQCVQCKTHLTEDTIPTTVTILPLREMDERRQEDLQAQVEPAPQDEEEPFCVYCGAASDTSLCPACHEAPAPEEKSTQRTAPTVAGPIPSDIDPSTAAKIAWLRELMTSDDAQVAAALRRSQVRVHLPRTSTTRTRSTSTTGSKAVGRKMDEGKVRDLRARHTAGEDIKTLAATYEISLLLAKNIIKRLRWASVA